MTKRASKTLILLALFTVFGTACKSTAAKAPAAAGGGQTTPAADTSNGKKEEKKDDKKDDNKVADANALVATPASLELNAGDSAKITIAGGKAPYTVASDSKKAALAGAEISIKDAAVEYKSSVSSKEDKIVITDADGKTLEVAVKIKGSFVALEMKDAPKGRVGSSVSVDADLGLIVWGGKYNDSKGVEQLSNEGGIYKDKKWVAMKSEGAPSARSGALSMLMGSKLVIVGGRDKDKKEVLDGGIYDLTAQKWEKVEKDEKIKGFGIVHALKLDENTIQVISLTDLSKMAKLDISKREWTVLTAAGAPKMSASRAVHDKSGKVYLVGNEKDGKVLEAAIYDPTPGAANVWTSLSKEGAPAVRKGFALALDAVSSKLIVWGGNPNDTSTLSDGKILDLKEAKWTKEVSKKDAPVLKDTAATRAILIEDKGALLVAGDMKDGVGGIYDVASDSWTALNKNASALKDADRLIKSGSEIISWGANPGIYTP